MFMDKILKLHQRGMGNQMTKKFIVALFGAAGSGKDTIQKEIIKQSPLLCHEIISSTTRPPREYERDYVDYHFISDDEAKKYLDNGDYLEYAEFRGWHYGTLKQSLRPDKINIGVFNIAGIKQLLQLPWNEYVIFPIHITCSDKTRFLRQLNREINPDCEEICRRFKTDKEDFDPKNINFHHFIIENEYNEISALIQNEILPWLYETILLECIQDGYLSPNEDSVCFTSKKSFGQNDIILTE